MEALRPYAPGEPREAQRGVCMASIAAYFFAPVLEQGFQGGRPLVGGSKGAKRPLVKAL